MVFVLELIYIALGIVAACLIPWAVVESVRLDRASKRLDEELAILKDLRKQSAELR